MLKYLKIFDLRRLVCHLLPRRLRSDPYGPPRLGEHRASALAEYLFEYYSSVAASHNAICHSRHLTGFKRRHGTGRDGDEKHILHVHPCIHNTLHHYPPPPPSHTLKSTLRCNCVWETSGGSTREHFAVLGHKHRRSRFPLTPPRPRHHPSLPLYCCSPALFPALSHHLLLPVSRLQNVKTQ